jgi:uncharacterized protein (UPF0332 family)
LNKKILSERINAELDRAKEALKAAETLLAEELYADSLSRSYYCILHGARAVLLTKEIDPESHSGAIAMFGLHFIKEKILEEEYNRIFIEAREAREIGDYQVETHASQEDAKIRLSEAKKFINRMGKHLREEKFI